MDATIAALLIQDGVTNGAIYALLALAIVLVFAVTRVIFVPSGELVSYGTLTLAGLQLGKPPGTVGLLVGPGAIGLIAGSGGLGWAMGAVAIAAGVVAVSVSRIPWQSEPSSETVVAGYVHAADPQHVG